ncbi:hypothetical protein SESBI_40523 [Sesbania bispinosa]|nr:hypothetical protein SESBI_40523 [Sesbania bispinosa]
MISTSQSLLESTYYNLPPFIFKLYWLLMEYMNEVEGKSVHDYYYQQHQEEVKMRRPTIWVWGPVIVGVGPSGLAAAASLKEKGIPSLILERAHYLASMWQLKTYGRLCLHLPKQFCQLPLMPFPNNFPSYPTKQQFLAYLKAYVDHFDIKPAFSKTVVSVDFDHRCGFCRVKTTTPQQGGLKKDAEETGYVCQWLIVALSFSMQRDTLIHICIQIFEHPK